MKLGLVMQGGLKAMGSNRLNNNLKHHIRQPHVNGLFVNKIPAKSFSASCCRHTLKIGGSA